MAAAEVNQRWGHGGMATVGMDNDFGRVTSRDGTSIAFERVGHGAPVILLLLVVFNGRSTVASCAAIVSGSRRQESAAL